jgi:hypothetical protein
MKLNTIDDAFFIKSIKDLYVDGITLACYDSSVVSL